ncbi:kinase-like protein [Aspergillus piperis CBS 112811]|uniref:non-specific serine/threonine protein kinase n=1 Tax=Aspergillus piperis CBS 112811 TaxID=1448313 RepID=A0A8G1RFH6_9EURO|nr:kinase-like protein [Aspergillus piperis CBS 112811]RAH63465.1 kinase-like protein [Aspergillus piperis CBS 112811]
MHSISRGLTRISFLRAKPHQLSRSLSTTTSIPQHEPVDEEFSPGYNPKLYYPAQPGEILADHYRLLVKIGWGSGSTVWLARDVARHVLTFIRNCGHGSHSKPLFEPPALKILNNNNPKGADHERRIEEHIAEQTPSHRGRPVIRSYLESFELAGPISKHICLAYEPSREPLWLYQRRFEGDRFTLPMVKAYILIILAGLDYLHSVCKVVHTGEYIHLAPMIINLIQLLSDLKLDNILITFEYENILPRFVKEQEEAQSMQCKTDPETVRVIYRCHNNFGPLDPSGLGNIYPQITDFGAATLLGTGGDDGAVQLGTRPIQPDYYRAPEVILGCGWSYSADIWNLGVMIWNILEGTELFTQVQDAEGTYLPEAHLAQMIALLGPPPKKLLVMSESMAQVDEWSPAITDERGKIFKNNREYFGGPFFDEEGNFFYNDLIPARKLEDAVPSLEASDKEAFLSFIKQMLTWLPEERKTARELMEHPFLND